MPKKIITQNNLPSILLIINTWRGKLTWELLCQRISLHLNIEGGIQRQTLLRYKEIKDAYKKRADALKDGSLASIPIEDTDKMVEHLTRENGLLRIELDLAKKLNETYKQRFILWQYNAYQHGVKMHSLDSESINKSTLKKLHDMLEKPLTEVKRRTGGK